MNPTKQWIKAGSLILLLVPATLGFLTPTSLFQRFDEVASAIGHTLLGNASAQTDNDPYATYHQALDILKSDYYGKTFNAKTDTDLTYAAISGMLYTLNDPFTSFLDPEEWQQMRQTTSGEFDGIGAVLEPYGKDVRIKNPLPGTPAAKAGLKSNDIIMSVGIHNPVTGKLIKTVSVLGKSIDDVVKLIKGPRGTPVTVTVIRKGVAKPLSFVIRRAHITPPIVQYWMEDKKDKIGHIVLAEFNEQSVQQLDHAWNVLQRQGMRALIFDLRENPGGLLNVAVDIGSKFIRKGPVVIIQEGRGGVRQGLMMEPSQHNHKLLPIVVLVNEDTASAAEIVTGAIKDNHTGVIMGTHTFGKGLVQTLFELPGGSALRLTTAKYFTPNGTDISNKYDEEHRPIFGTGGIKPNIVVKQNPNWIPGDFNDKKDDTQLHAALAYLRKELAGQKQLSTAQ